MRNPRALKLPWEARGNGTPLETDMAKEHVSRGSEESPGWRNSGFHKSYGDSCYVSNNGAQIDVDSHYAGITKLLQTLQKVGKQQGNSTKCVLRILRHVTNNFAFYVSKNHDQE